MKKKRRGRPRNPDPNWVTDAEAAKHAGVTRQAIHGWRKQYPDAPKRRLDGRCRLDEYLAWFDRFGLRGRRKQEDIVEEHQIRLRRERLRLEREEFEFEQIKERMLPAGQFEAALAKTMSKFLASLNAFGPRVNEKLEGLDFDDRAQVIDREVELLKKTLASCDYLCVEEEDEELAS